ncbi:MAG: hypothetical protein HY051_00600 [Candidatus Aenigmarchaeota archaeon]|nr:hypothetical protein [Candidatus Aenigmarchaeota archaeon]
MHRKFVIIIEKAGNNYIASVPALYGCRSLTKKFDKVAESVRRAIINYLKKEEYEEPADFFGIQVIKVRGKEFTAAIEKSGKYYIACVPTVSGCFTQAGTVNMVVKNIRELLEFYSKEKNLINARFIGMQTVEI